jgi:O-antigen ligase
MNLSPEFRQQIPARALLGIGIFIIALLIAFFIVVAPELAIYLGRYVLMFVAVVVIFKLVSPSAPFWVRTLFLVVIGELVLGYGFGGITVGTGSARVTLAELVLACVLLWIAFKSWTAFWIAGSATFYLLAYAVPPLIIHLLPDLIRHGVTAARDALPLVDSLFFLAGIGVVALSQRREQWVVWRHRFFWTTLIATLCYLPLYPFQKTLLAYSPAAYGYQYSTPIIGYFSSSNALALVGLLAVVLTPNFFAKHSDKPAPRWLLLLAFVIYLAGIVMLQSRATYVAAGLSLIALALNRHGRAVWGFLLAMTLAVIVLFAVDLSGLEIKGRVGHIGIEVLTGQLKSVAGEDQNAASGASGLDLRMSWWRDSLTRWNASLETNLVGIGFGQSLTNFTTKKGAGLVREPHNSYISVLTRTGIVGLLPWLAFQATLMLTVWRKFLKQRKTDSRSAGYWLWLFLFFMILLVEAIVEPVFEVPYFAAPYFFIAGMALAEIARDKAGWKEVARVRGQQQWARAPA